MSTLEDLDAAKAAAQTTVTTCGDTLQASRIALGTALTSLGVLVGRGPALASSNAVGINVATIKPTTGLSAHKQQVAGAQASAATPAAPSTPATYTSAMIPALIDDFVAKKTAYEGAQKALSAASAALSAAMKSK